MPKRATPVFAILAAFSFALFLLARLDNSDSHASMLPTLAVLPTETDEPVSPTFQPTNIKPTQPTALPAPSVIPPSQEPEQAAVPNRVLVQFGHDEERSAYAEQMRALGATVTTIDALNTLVIDLPAAETLPPLPPSAVSEPDYVVTALHSAALASSDPLLADQWGLQAIGAADAWHHINLNMPTVTIAVIDSGICADHPDLVGRVLPGKDYVDGDNDPTDMAGHGCAVSGVIAANTDNAIGIAGAAPNTRILPLRVLDEKGSGKYSNVASAIVYAVDTGAPIINLSLGGPNASSILENAVNYAAERGVTVVAAAGNTGQIGALFPARYASVIAVGSLDSNLQPSSFSNYGDDVDLWAPGASIRVLDRMGGYGWQSGTSFAAPHVSAIAALERLTGGTLNSGGLVKYGGSTIIVDTTDEAPDSALTGTLGLLYGDPQDTTQIHLTYILLHADDGSTAQLDMPLTDAIPLNGQRVEVNGTESNATAAATFAPRVIQVTSIRPLGPAAQGDAFAAAFTGTKPFLTLLCRFSDKPALPHPASWYGALYSDTYPGLNHFWKQTSYNLINIDSSLVVEEWFTLPEPESAYMNGQFPDWDKIVNDCTTLANASSANPYFPFYFGINIMLNGDIGGAAWGGRTQPISLDGITRSYAATWMPPWAHMPGVLAHEMGHGFGLPHSSGPYNETYDSYWDVMSGGGRTHYWYSDPPTDMYIPVGTIGYHLDLLGWLAPNQRVTVNSGEYSTFTLEQLQLPQNTTNPRLIIIPIPHQDQFYTVEARRYTGYDDGLEGQAVILHLVDPKRPQNDRMAQVVDIDNNRRPNDAAAMWLPGEIFRDSKYDVCVSIISLNASSFTVGVSNNAPGTGVELHTPVDGETVTANPRFQWLAYSGATEYEIEVARNSRFTSGQFLTTGISGTAYTLEAPLADGLYYWRVRPANGSPCLWSAGRSFVIDSTAPFITRYETSTPTLTWMGISYAMSYQVQISRKADMSEALGIYTTTDVVTPEFTTPTLDDGRWYWRVRAQQADGTFGDWSTIESFSIDAG